MKRRAIISEDTDVFSPEMPERTLLAAVVERAYRDLYCNNHTAFRAAMKWALPEKELYIEDDISEGISFKHCIAVLNLSIQRVNFVKNAAEGFVKYLNDIDTFKTDRPTVIKIRQFSFDQKRDFIKSKRQKWRRGHVVR